MKKLIEFKEIKHTDILRSMIDYMNFDEYDDFDCGYTQKEIDKCGKILDDYIDELEKCRKDEKLIKKQLKKVILKLNKLNESCDSSLIETDQREYLCPFIEDAAVAAGLTKSEEDITLEWREW